MIRHAKKAILIYCSFSLVKLRRSVSRSVGYKEKEKEKVAKRNVDKLTSKYFQKILDFVFAMTAILNRVVTTFFLLNIQSILKRGTPGSILKKKSFGRWETKFLYKRLDLVLFDFENT